MKKTAVVLISSALLILCTSWGFFAHQRINQLAVFTLPAGMFRFYKPNIKYITEHAIDPDKRRYLDTLEAPRHYLDVENYEDEIDSIPEKWTDAVAKYGLKKLNKDGIVPWHIQRVYYTLVKAFKEHDSVRILRASADLGHYIGDAHVPLHTTQNHNGQLTNQTGIHAFWESRIPELFSSKYNFLVGRAVYIENPLKAAWKIVKHTHLLADTVLKLEAQLNASFRSDRKYSYSERNNVVLKQYSEEYSFAYQQLLKGMVERQMRASIHSIGSFWFSAWVDAGQPELKGLVKTAEPAMETQDALIAEKFKNGKILGREY